MFDMTLCTLGCEEQSTPSHFIEFQSFQTQDYMVPAYIKLV